MTQNPRGNDLKEILARIVKGNGAIKEEDKMPRTIRMTLKEARIISDNAGWTPYWFETSHGIVTIPGPTEDYIVYEDDDRLSCGCCECCGCSCWMDDVEGAYFYEDEEEDEE